MKLDNSKARTPSHIWQPHKNQSKKWKNIKQKFHLSVELGNLVNKIIMHFKVNDGKDKNA